MGVQTTDDDDGFAGNVQPNAGRIISWRKVFHCGRVSLSSMRQVDSTESRDRPQVEPVPDDVGRFRACPELNFRQLAREVTRNPKPKPTGTNRFSVHAEAHLPLNVFSVESYRLLRTRRVTP